MTKKKEVLLVIKKLAYKEFIKSRKARLKEIKKSCKQLPKLEKEAKMSFSDFKKKYK